MSVVDGFHILEGQRWVLDFWTKCHQESCFIEFRIRIVFHNSEMSHQAYDTSKKNRHSCDIRVFLFFIEKESVGIRAQFCEKYAMFGETVFQARDYDFLRRNTIVAE